MELFDLSRAWVAASGLLLLALIGLAASPTAAQEPQPVVTASFEGAPTTVSTGVTVDLVLRLTANADAVDVTAEILPAPMVQVVGGLGRWSGSLARGAVLDIPISVQFTGSGEYTLGARVTNRLVNGQEQVTGTVLYVTVTAGAAHLSIEPRPGEWLQEPAAVGEVVVGVAEPPPPLRPGEARAVPDPRMESGTVSGTVQWQDPDGHFFPVRRALVAFYDGTDNYLGVQTSTNDAGAYSATVNTPTNSVMSKSLAQDVDNTRVAVFPSGQSNLRYLLQTGVLPIAHSMTQNIQTGRPVLGSPGAPSPDTDADRSARIMAVYDAMLTFWFQFTGLIGHNMQQALTNYPRTDGTISFYDPNTQQMVITRERAFAWDVLGHEFTHFGTNRAALRPIDNNPGGSHSGGSAIGQLPCATCSPRNRDEGMRLAWSEGLATYFSLALQNQPADPGFPFPATLARIGDGRYTTTENFILDYSAETPDSNEGFGSENSVLAMLWDFLDTNQDGDQVIDSIAGVGPQLLWSAINTLLPCNPCDRVDRVWTGVRNFFGADNLKGFVPAGGLAVGNAIITHAKPPFRIC